MEMKDVLSLMFQFGTFLLNLINTISMIVGSTRQKKSRPPLGLTTRFVAYALQ